MLMLTIVFTMLYHDHAEAFQRPLLLQEQLRRTSHAGVGERQADQEFPQLIIPLHLDKLNGLHGMHTIDSCKIKINLEAWLFRLHLAAQA